MVQRPLASYLFSLGGSIDIARATGCMLYNTSLFQGSENTPAEMLRIGLEGWKGAFSYDHND